MRENGKIDYVELRGADLTRTKEFYAAAFDWSFTDFGPRYSAFDEGLDGGLASGDDPRAPLVVLYATGLEAMAARVEGAGGVITRPIFAFPGGRRFHFRDPAGNELAVWSRN